MHADSPVTEPAASSEERSPWPCRSLVLWGTFGTTTPVGRRYHNRSLAALAVFLLVHFLLGAWRDVPAVRALIALTPGAVFGFIAWELRRYLLALDELSRRIQMEAITWTYLLGLVAAMAWAGLATAYGSSWYLHPAWFLLLEPVRGFVLRSVARRY